MSNIIWQPTGLYQPTYNVGIILDGEFAQKMIEANIPRERQNRINRMGTELTRSLRQDHPFPYTFQEDSPFVTKFSIAGKGVGLSIDRVIDKAIENVMGNRVEESFRESKPIVYGSHNVDNSMQAYVLMALVEMWVRSVNLLKE
ncbi:hypothetical protein COV20_01025 [Candidatus Woesearchaeota archaeon CG10_big_fil_rev_8_21_14_0_10_45_16]|nr:MAG: hypothetical protein COV20_01025 [Candidatus Woesearchaeota archaeon CG10_big_fil_rev_8_21_14_0_10_45_16]